MTLKNLLLIISACCYTLVTAQNVTPPSLYSQNNVQTKLHKVESPELLKDKWGKPASLVSQICHRAKLANQQVTDSQFSITEIRAKTEDKAKSSQLRMDSVIKTNPDGSKFQRIYFTFNEQNITTRQVNSYWNAEANSWDTAEDYKYEWDKDGYLLIRSVEGYGQGQRYEFTYNDRKLGISQIFSILTNGEWVNQTKAEYKYDDRENIIDEMIYVWDGTAWIKNTHNTATWDEENRQTSIVSMVWNGTEWVGITKEDYTYWATDKISYKGMWRWLEDSKEWQLVDMFFQEFNQAGQLTAQKRKFWNDERKDWSGEYESWGPGSGICYTYDATITYDEKGRTTLQQHKECYNDSTEWVVRSEMITEWTDGLENGDYEYEMNAYLYDYPSYKKTWNQREYGRYNAQGLRTWILLQMQNLDATEMNDNYEEKYRYDERGNLLYSASWDWKDGVRKPTTEENNTYDADGNIIESYYRSGTSGGGIIIGSPRKAAGHEPQDDEGWVNTSHFTYKYENGCRVEKMGYKWDGSDYLSNLGQVAEYDWNVPTSELIAGLGYADPYKLDYVYDYVGDGNGGWLISTSTYYYSGQASGIQQNEAGKITFADNILTITGGKNIDNRVYDLTGKQIYQGNNPEENLNHLSKGIYVVKSSIDNKPYTLKIVIK